MFLERLHRIAGRRQHRPWSRSRPRQSLEHGRSLRWRSCLFVIDCSHCLRAVRICYGQEEPLVRTLSSPSSVCMWLTSSACPRRTHKLLALICCSNFGGQIDLTYIACSTRFARLVAVAFRLSSPAVCTGPGHALPFARSRWNIAELVFGVHLAVVIPRQLTASHLNPPRPHCAATLQIAGATHRLITRTNLHTVPPYGSETTLCTTTRRVTMMQLTSPDSLLH